MCPVVLSIALFLPGIHRALSQTGSDAVPDQSAYKTSLAANVSRHYWTKIMRDNKVETAGSGGGGEVDTNGWTITAEQAERLLVDMRASTTTSKCTSAADRQEKMEKRSTANTSATNCTRVRDVLDTYKLSDKPLGVDNLVRASSGLLYAVQQKNCDSDSTTVAGQTTPKPPAGGKDKKSKPTPAEIWGYSFLLVTVINICSLVGAFILPFRTTRYYKGILSFMIALAVGTLAGSGLLFLIPDAFGFPDIPELANYHWKSLVVIAGIYLFFLTERVLKMIMAAKEMHGHSHSNTYSEPVEPPKLISMHSTEEHPALPNGPRPRGRTRQESIRVAHEEMDHVISWVSHHTPEAHVTTLHLRDIEADLPPTPATTGTVNSSGAAVAAAINRAQCACQQKKIATLDQELNKDTVTQNMACTCGDDMQDTISDVLKNKEMSEGGIVLSNRRELAGAGGDFELGTSQSAKQLVPPTEDTGEVDAELGKIAPVAWMIIFGDGLHNFIDGLTIGAAFTTSVLGGLSVGLAIFSEEFPHELGDFAILLASGMSRKQALCFNFLSACTCYVGLLFGILLGEMTSASHWIFAVAGGMFLYIALVDMLPEVNHEAEQPENTSSIGKMMQVFLIHNAGLLTGFGLMLVLCIFSGDITLGA